jgi:uncharacterized protein YbbC (DUF1343 family)
MKKKIALLVLFTLLFSTLCLYAAPRSVNAIQTLRELRDSLDKVTAQRDQLIREKKTMTRDYEKATQLIKELQRQIEKVDNFCSVYDPKSTLPGDLQRAAYDLCYQVENDY